MTLRASTAVNSSHCYHTDKTTTSAAAAAAADKSQRTNERTTNGGATVWPHTSCRRAGWPTRGVWPYRDVWQNVIDSTENVFSGQLIVNNSTG